MDIVVGVGEYASSSGHEAKLKTYALASCIAVTVYCKARKAAGMVHIALPYPRSELTARERPAYYASTGIPLLVKHMCRKYHCTGEELQIELFGGAVSTRKYDLFAIGIKNMEAVIKTLEDLKLNVYRADVGGYVSRTLEMNVATGEIRVSTRPLLI